MIKEIIMTEKSFFRIRVKDACPYTAIIVKNLGKVTKTWELKKGKASDYAVYPNLDVQAMIKEGNTFVPAPDATSAAGDELNGTGGSSSNSPAPEPQSDETVTDNFFDMTVEQLKAYLSAKGVPSGELRSMVKADLIARAEAISLSESETAQG
jgi:hypothetical protein